ncbi:MAG: sugar transferase [Acidimicrobiia bacterium]|nr:sugar transferase [Acidimicrobiia bacterium]
MAQVEASSRRSGSMIHSAADAAPISSRHLVLAREVAEVRLREGIYLRFVKPACDRFFAAVILVVLSPVLLFTSIALRLTLGKGVLFRQERIGKGGVPFTVLKFRTMKADRRQERVVVESDRRRTHKSTSDPRHTRLGKLLRSTAIDELPQFVNVLRGDMSIIGPRPELPIVVEKYEPWQHLRHDVRPGLTGLWQVSERGKGEAMHERVDVDLSYCDSVGFLTDLRILLATPFALICARGE